ncbi:MAG: tetratricopeptide repeat protein [Pseudomonadota bacterium]
MIFFQFRHSDRCGAQTAGRLCLIVFLILFFAPCFFGSFSGSCSPPAFAADTSEEESFKELLKQREEKLWKDANEALRLGKDQEAAESFLRYYRKYPVSPLAEEALWQSANLHRELALGNPAADWELVKDLFRSYTIDYPDSPRQADTYFQVANAYFEMGYYREALTYFGLFIKKFQFSPQIDEARYMKARILLQIGRLSDAVSAYEDLGLSRDPVYQLRAQAGGAHIDFARKKYHDSLAIYLKILRHDPTFYVSDPDILRNKGIAHLRVGNHEEGRNDLLQYLNISGFTPFRSEILFELAESYGKAGQEEAAEKFYMQVVDEGKPEDREVVLSRFRLAQLEKPDIVEKDAAEGVEQVPPLQDDQPFQAVLETQYADPVSQDARLEMIRRHWQRDELDQAYAMGKAYLRHQASQSESDEVADIMGKVLVKRMEKMLQEKKYGEMYQLYQDEYPQFKAYKGGRLLYLVGRALEEMALYRQAGVVYYRAMALPSSDEDLLELYIHRAWTYLADNDLKAAQRLLKYLRIIYASNPALGEICWLSGQLRERQERPADAMEFYKMAVESPTFAEKKNIYAADYLRLLFDQGAIFEKSNLLAAFARQKWLPPLELQQWYGMLGDRYREAGNSAKAAEAYGSAVGEGMPADNETAQMLQLRLGDMLYLQGKKEEAGVHFQRAAEGKDDLVKKLAEQRLRQESIKKSMAEAEAVLKN